MIRTISQNLVLCLAFAQGSITGQGFGGKEFLRFDRVKTPEVRSMEEEQYGFCGKLAR